MISFYMPVCERQRSDVIFLVLFIKELERLAHCYETLQDDVDISIALLYHPNSLL